MGETGEKLRLAQIIFITALRSGLNLITFSPVRTHAWLRMKLFLPLFRHVKLNGRHANQAERQQLTGGD